jgi:hypothetical protein
VNVVPFAAEHLPLLEGWMAARGTPLEPGAVDYLPRVGFVADDCLIGFLFRTDAPAVGYLDSFVGDPDVPPERLRAAMRALIFRLQLAARQLGIKLLAGHSAVPSIVDGCRANGWTIHTERRPATFVTIDLREI